MHTPLCLFCCVASPINQDNPIKCSRVLQFTKVGEEVGGGGGGGGRESWWGGIFNLHVVNQQLKYKPNAHTFGGK